MAEIKKIRRTALVLFVVLGLVALWAVLSTAVGLFQNTADWNATLIINTLAGALIMFATLGVALVLLRSTQTEESPFNLKNVRRLKIIAILLVVFEPYSYVSQWVLSKLYPIVLPGDITVEVHSSLGGVVFAAGLVVYCVSLVFSYGISLQAQVDETL